MESDEGVLHMKVFSVRGDSRSSWSLEGFLHKTGRWDCLIEETISSHFIWEVEFMDHKLHKVHKPESIFSSSLSYTTPFDYLFFLDRCQYTGNFPGVWAHVVKLKATEKASKHLLPATSVPSQRYDHFDGSCYHNPWPIPRGSSPALVRAFHIAADWEINEELGQCRI